MVFSTNILEARNFRNTEMFVLCISFQSVLVSLYVNYKFDSVFSLKPLSFAVRG